MIRHINAHELKHVSEFIYTKNHEQDKRSFYMSLSMNSIMADVDQAYSSALLFGSFDTKLNGVMVCYKHPQEHVMDVAGPFYHDEKIAIDLIDYVTSLYTSYDFNFFFDQNHKELIQIMTKYQHNFNGYEFQMNLYRKEWVKLLLPNILTPLDQNTSHGFIHLYQEIFPDAYISAHDIVLNKDQTRDVYLVLDNGFTIGYLVIKSYPLYPRKKTIEMVGVKESERSKGIGKKIINQALDIIFSHTIIESVDLIVDLDNTKALTLYEQFGFKVIQTGVSITIKT